MRSRNIKPGFFMNEELADIGPYAQILFIGLWQLADREGKLEDRPRRIKASIFPYYDPKPSIETLLNHLKEHNFIIRYRVKKLKLIKVVNFVKHQSIHHTEKNSIFPEPCDSPEYNGYLTVNSPLHDGENPPDILNTDILNTDIHARGASEVKKENGFDQFWKAYPKKKSKGDAEKAWAKAKKLPEFDINKILGVVAKQRESPDWKKENGQFIPFPATWLNKKRWCDEDAQAQMDDYDAYMQSLIEKNGVHYG